MKHFTKALYLNMAILVLAFTAFVPVVAKADTYYTSKTVNLAAGQRLTLRNLSTKGSFTNKLMLSINAGASTEINLPWSYTAQATTEIKVSDMTNNSNLPGSLAWVSPAGDAPISYPASLNGAAFKFTLKFEDFCVEGCAPGQPDWDDLIADFEILPNPIDIYVLSNKNDAIILQNNTVHYPEVRFVTIVAIDGVTGQRYTGPRTIQLDISGPENKLPKYFLYNCFLPPYNVALGELDQALFNERRVEWKGFFRALSQNDLNIWRDRLSLLGRQVALPSWLPLRLPLAQDRGEMGRSTIP